ncbi:MAG: PilT protein domain protein [Acidimicrobiales bacterium]|nr:PilT protein domain protein [Acidimicrobiales bacterium]
MLPFDLDVTGHYADVVAGREETGRSIHQADGQIAAICRRYRLPLATRNTRDFEDTGLELIDPWLS